MTKIALVAAAAALFAIPAAASAQAYVQVETGLDEASINGDSKTGVDYGVSVGYDHQLSGGLFVGLQASLADADTKKCAIYSEGDKECVEAGRDIAALVRVGTAVGAKGKLYVMGGYANGRIEDNYRAGNVVYSDGHSDLDGLRLGAGYEYALNEKLFLKAEYHYTNYAEGVSRNQGIVALGTKF